MKWVFATNEQSLQSEREDWPRLIRAAVNSAKCNTSLDPILLYDGAEIELIRDLKADGVTVIQHRSSLYPFLKDFHSRKDPQNFQIASGAFLRIDVPVLFRDEFVLYTDCDVIFLRDVDIAEIRPNCFACAPERNRGDKKNINTGVMLMNTRALRQDHGDFCAFIQNNYSNLVSYDQGAYLSFYKDRYEILPDEMNWKPYWGYDSGATIVHFHGPKPRTVLGLLAGLNLPLAPILRELYEVSPNAYKSYVKAWSDFVYPSPQMQSLGETASAPRPAGFHLDIADDPRFIADLVELRRCHAGSERTTTEDIFFGGQPPNGGLMNEMPLTDIHRVRRRIDLCEVARLSASMMEIGFDAGHSALACLNANPKLYLTVIDRFELESAKESVSYLQRRYPDRLSVIEGEPCLVMPCIAIENPRLRFDAFHLHGGWRPYADCAILSNCIRVAANNALFLLDDLRSPSLAFAAEDYRRRGYFRSALNNRGKSSGHFYQALHYTA